MTSLSAALLPFCLGEGVPLESALKRVATSPANGCLCAVTGLGFNSINGLRFRLGVRWNAGDRYGRRELCPEPRDPRTRTPPTLLHCRNVGTALTDLLLAVVLPLALRTSLVRFNPPRTGPGV